MTSRIHRGLWRVAISLALGAIVTVLVAWRCHRFAWMEGTRTKIENPEWPIAVPSTWPPAPKRAERTEDGPIAIEESHWHPDRWGGGQPCLVRVYESGWPRRAMVRYLGHQGWIVSPPVLDTGLFRSGVPSPFNLQWTNTPNPNYLPILPMWPGFAINTIFYGTFAFAAMAGFTAITRRRRFKRGLCVQCAYPRTGGDLCPECGTAVSRSVACVPQIKAVPLLE